MISYRVIRFVHIINYDHLSGVKVRLDENIVLGEYLGICFHIDYSVSVSLHQFYTEWNIRKIYSQIFSENTQLDAPQRGITTIASLVRARLIIYRSKITNRQVFKTNLMIIHSFQCNITFWLRPAPHLNILEHHLYTTVFVLKLKS